MKLNPSDNVSEPPDEMVGSNVKRREDPALVKGEAEYTDDIQYPRMAYLAILRSQHAHAKIKDIDTREVEHCDGIIGVFTSNDIEKSDAPGILPVVEPDSAKFPDHKLLADHRVRYQGEPIAGVVADHRYQAHEALENIEVDYERIDVITDPEEALKSNAPTLHKDINQNKSFDWDFGDRKRTEHAFEDAAYNVSVNLVNNRVMPAAMEPRAAVANYMSAKNNLKVELSAQKPHEYQKHLAYSLGMEEQNITVRAPDVGGGFGSKGQCYPDEVLTAWCAIELQRPIKWQATRSEGMSSTFHGRDHITSAEMALSHTGEILGFRVNTVVNLGAYLSYLGAVLPQLYSGMLSGQYEIPSIYANVIGAFTNTTPTASYRGAGRPEAAYVIERTIDRAADELDIDPTEIRRRNLIPPDKFPYESVTGYVYDSGDYELSLSRALELVKYDEFRERQEKLRKKDRYLGIGFSCYAEVSGVGPGHPESGRVRFHPSGGVTISTGTKDHGQGLHTSFAQIISDKLGIPYDDIVVKDGDTGRDPEGHGTSGSRSVTLGGHALLQSADKIIEQCRSLAAYKFEAHVDDIEFSNGSFQLKGSSERTISIQELSRLAYESEELPSNFEPGLEATTYYNPENYTFPFGTHAAIVEVSPEVGDIKLKRFVAVDDCGRQINPTIVEGQVHGGVVQGIGQALYEQVEYDDNGNLITGSLQDYVIPKSNQLPPLETSSTVTPSPNNKLGVKGVGESGAIGAPPAIINALVDALKPFDVKHIDMPVSSEDIWRAAKGDS